MLFCGFVLYDTQLIVAKCRRGDKDFVWGGGGLGFKNGIRCQRLVV